MFKRLRFTYGVVLRAGDHRFLLGYRVDYPLDDDNDPIEHIILMRYRVRLRVAR